MELAAGQVAVVTGAGSGIGLALAERFALAGLDVVLADVQDDALDAAAARVGGHGVATLTVHTDVSKQGDVQALAEQAVERFGAVHVVCNNAGVVARADPWFGPLNSWEWVMGVNFWGVVYGCRTFLPHLIGGGHIVNTASMAGLMPGFAPSYDASKHAVVALTEDLFNTVRLAGLPVGVSVLCPGWVRTNIVEADRNWPAELGDKPVLEPAMGVLERHVRRAVDEGSTPAFIADHVADAISADRFWVLPNPEFVEVAVRRWESIAEGADPAPFEQIPGMPPRAEIMAEALAALGGAPPAGDDQAS
jgi:NAD(P)-dependent dehydrogenase (short-subunit alcohol dehydrogenase family)